MWKRINIHYTSEIPSVHYEQWSVKIYQNKYLLSNIAINFNSFIKFKSTPGVKLPIIQNKNNIE